MQSPEANSCPFCALSPKRELQSTALAVAVRDAYPVAEGHTLVVPRRHVGRLADCTAQELADLWTLAEQVRGSLAIELDPPPDGFNIGVNDGEAAGQTVMHCHLHVIPRWRGDVPDPRGGVRWVIAERATYWKDGDGDSE